MVVNRAAGHGKTDGSKRAPLDLSRSIDRAGWRRWWLPVRTSACANESFAGVAARAVGRTYGTNSIIATSPKVAIGSCDMKARKKRRRQVGACLREIVQRSQLRYINRSWPSSTVFCGGAGVGG